MSCPGLGFPFTTDTFGPVQRDPHVLTVICNTGFKMSEETCWLGLIASHLLLTGMTSHSLGIIGAWKLQQEVPARYVCLLNAAQLTTVICSSSLIPHLKVVAHLWKTETFAIWVKYYWMYRRWRMLCLKRMEMGSLPGACLSACPAKNVLFSWYFLDESLGLTCSKAAVR